MKKRPFNHGSFSPQKRPKILPKTPNRKRKAIDALSSGLSAIYTSSKKKIRTTTSTDETKTQFNRVLKQLLFFTKPRRKLLDLQATNHKLNHTNHLLHRLISHLNSKLLNAHNQRVQRCEKRKKCTNRLTDKKPWSTSIPCY